MSKYKSTRKSILVILLTIAWLCCGVSYTQDQSNRRLFPITIGGRCGYLSISGQMIVSPQYEMCTEFHEGRAAVLLNRKYGFIDASGQLVTPLMFEDYIYPQYFEGLTPAIWTDDNGRRAIGYADRFGRLQVVKGVDETYDFSEGMAKIRKKDRYGFIDSSMRIVIPPKYVFVQSFRDGLANVLTESGLTYFIDKLGQTRIKGFVINSSFSDGLVRFRDRSGLFGFLDTYGRTVIEPRFSNPCGFSNGLACAENDGKWGYIDRVGQFVISPQFTSCEDFSADGFAVVEQNGKRGIIDKSGQLLLPAVYDSIDWMQGLALVKSGPVIQYVNLDRKVVWPK